MNKPNANAVHRRWDWDYPVVEKTEGIYIWDTNGNKYIDGSGGSSVVTSIGHGVKAIPLSMAEQYEKFAFYPAHTFSNSKLLELCDLIVGIAPGNLKDNSKVWMTVTGSDATDDAARLARQYWLMRGEKAKHIIISRWQSFHGNNLFTTSISGHTGRRRIYTPMYRDMAKIPPAYCYRCPFEKSLPECDLLCARALEDAICQAGPENVAAFIAEPVVGAALGAYPAPDGYFQIIREICDKYDVLFIVDEVMTALGRTGRLWGIEHWDTSPDIVALSKSLTSGYYPTAAVIARDEIWESLKANNSHFIAGHTLNASVIGMVAALETINYILTNELVENAQKAGEYFLNKLKAFEEFESIGDVRGKGMMVGLEIVEAKKSKTPFPSENQVANLLSSITFKHGLVTYPCTGMVRGIAGDVIMMAPPLITTNDQIDEIVEILQVSVREFENQVL